MPTLESKLIIGAKDETGAAFASIQKHIADIDKQVATFDKLMTATRKVAGANDPMIAGIDRAAKSLAEEKTAAEALSRAMASGVVSAEEMASVQGRLARETTAATRAMSHQAAEAAASARKVTRSREGKSGGLGGIGTGLTAVAAGAAGVLIPFETYEGAKKALEASADLEQLKVRVREVSGGDKTETAFAEALAAEVAAKYPAITQAKALDTYLELRPNAANQNGSINQETARRNMMAVSQAQTAAAVVGTEITPEDAQNLLKAVEGSGRAGDPTAVGKMFDSYIRAKQVFGSAISTDKIRDYVQNAKSANFGIGEEEFFWQDIVRMTEGNASRLGNETAQTMQTLLSGHAKMQTAQWLTNLGLADGFTKSGGGNATIKGLHGADTLQLNNIDWVNKYLVPALKTHGYLTESVLKQKEDLLRKDSPGMSEEAIKERAMDAAIADAAMKSGARTTVTELLTHGAVNTPLINRDVRQMKDASGIGAAADIGKNPIAAMKEFTGSISNFAAVAGGPLMAPAAKALDALAHSIEDFTSRVQKVKGFWPSADDQKTYHAFSGPSPDAAIADFFADRRPLSPGGPGAGGWDLLNEWRHPSDGTPPAAAMPEHHWGPWHAGGSPSGPLMPKSWTPSGTALSGGADNAKLAAASAMPVNISGQAELQQTLNITIQLDPEIRAQIAAARSASVTIPLAGGGSGRMDSDAGPHRAGGVGSM
jgi:hypothetical protein